MTAPLAGVKVLEVGNFIAAPFCTMQLADLGADVIKIERPGFGDIVRSTGPFIDGESSPYLLINRNKRSLSLDMSVEEGRAVFERLASTADIIVENLSPGAMARLGFTYENLSANHPGLIYVSASGWGETGPYASYPGLDMIVQAMSGLMSITGEEGRPPVKVGVPITDLVCALYCALAAVTAYHVRSVTGKGQYIDVNLFESGVSLAVWEAGKYFATGEVPKRLGAVHQASAPYQAIEASDGYFCLGAPSPPTWRSLCSAFGLDDLIDHPDFVDNPHRFANREDLIARIEAVSKTKPVSHWIAQLQQVGVPCGAIRTYDAVFNDEHLAEREFFVKAPHAKVGSTIQIGSPMHLGDTPTEIRTAGPLLGEHTREIMRRAGYGDEEITDLLSHGVISAI
jgi:crotonobetainyl-CoA:carnitine CoA-transferase CaiB-like acyl-CoA transferase